MRTLVFLHAHPDDEAIATGGAMKLASDAGHRVVLVLATRGEVGEVAHGFLPAGQTLGQRRELETLDAAEILGVHRVEFLDYYDSGMMGEATNERPDCFWKAEVGEAAGRLLDRLAGERIDILCCYDHHGGYGHPDHIQVHRVGHRVGQVLGLSHVFEATINRTRVMALRAGAFEHARIAGEVPPDFPDPTEDDAFGMPEEVIDTAIDVSSVVEFKRRAMAAHSSQIGEASFFLAMSPEHFAIAFGEESFIRNVVGGGAPPVVGPDMPRHTSLW